MRRWSAHSQKVFNSLDFRLKVLVMRLRDEVGDISLLYGYRDRETQNGMYENGVSKLKYPKSYHNKHPSLAVDFQPYPMPTDDIMIHASLAYYAGHAMRIAREERFTIRWGGDWNENGILQDETFRDYYHIEIPEA